MAKFEKVGGFLLFEKIDEDKLSKSHLAGQISGNQIQQICIVKRFDQSLAGVPDFILDLNHEYETIKGLSNPNIVKANVFIQDKREFAAVFDYVEGRSLRSVLNKCSQDGFPFSVDHSLLVASRLCTALEYLHSKKLNDQRLVHGYVSPEAILVTYDGEIRLQYLGLTHALMKFPAGKEKLIHDYKNYLAPELLNQQKWDKAVDIYSTGLVLYEMLTSEPLDRTKNVQAAVNSAEMFSNSGDRVPVSDDLKKLLLHALAPEPAQRFSSISDMRKALDLILFSSEFSPTTFNLAFFMHSLFRDQIDEENKNIAQYKKTDVAPYLKEEIPPPAPVPKPQPKPQPSVPSAPVAMKKEAPAPAVHPPRTERLPQPAPPPVSSEMFGGAEEKEKSRIPIFVAALLILAVVGGLVYFFALKPSPAPVQSKPAQQPVPTLSPEQIQAQELERKRLEDEALRAQEEAKKKDEELKALQAKLDALIKAQQEEIRKQKASAKEAEAKQPTQSAADLAAIKKLQEEARKLEEEKKQQQLLAEQKLKEAHTPAADKAPVEQVASAANPPLPAPSDSSQQAEILQEQPKPIVEDIPAKPEVVEGMIVDLTPDVVKPEIVKRVNPNYPPIAQQKKVEGTVILSVLVSERGDVVDARVLRGAGGTSGLNAAAIDAVKGWKFRPAVKEGKRVKVWMTYPIVFKLQ
jgi:serine/threonine-protein kinase